MAKKVKNSKEILLQKPIKKVIEENEDINEGFKEFTNIDEDNPISKLIDQFFSDKDIEKKTELDKPLKWSALKMIEDKLEAKGLHLSANVIRQFRETSFRYLVSYKRQGRKEIIEALQSLTAFEKERKIEEVKSITGN